MSTSEGYTVGLNPTAVYDRPPSASGFSLSGEELVTAAGSSLSILRCRENGLELVDAFDWTDLSALGPDVGKGEEHIPQQLVMSTFGTLDRIPNLEVLKKLAVPPDYETNRNLSHKEATEVLELAVGVAPIKVLFTPVD